MTRTLMLGAVAAGLWSASAAASTALAYAKEREQFGWPIASFQLVQESSARCWVS